MGFAVIPAQAGIQRHYFSWTPACAGVTEKGPGVF
jgi:hypothetical protein